MIWSTERDLIFPRIVQLKFLVATLILHWTFSVIHSKTQKLISLQVFKNVSNKIPSDYLKYAGVINYYPQAMTPIQLSLNKKFTQAANLWRLRTTKFEFEVLPLVLSEKVVFELLCRSCNELFFSQYLYSQNTTRTHLIFDELVKAQSIAWKFLAQNWISPELIRLLPAIVMVKLRLWFRFKFMPKVGTQTKKRKSIILACVNCIIYYFLINYFLNIELLFSLGYRYGLLIDYLSKS